MAPITKLSREDFKDILSNYNIGKYKNSKHIFTGGNTVYKFVTTKGKFILKIYEHASQSFVQYQIKLSEYLKNKDVFVPKIIDKKSGGGLLIWRKKRIAIQEFVEGDEKLYANNKLAGDMGKKFAKLDRALMRFEAKHKNWHDFEFKLVKWKIESLLDMNVKKESRNLLNEIKKLDKNKLRKSLIHGDLCEGNFLVKNDKVMAMIDFDDAHEDYLVYELAVPIAHNFTTKKEVRKDLIKKFLREYQKYIKLNNEEKKALYLFIKHRGLASTYWCYDIMEKNLDQKEKLKEWAQHSLKRYKSFCRLSLNEFLELAK